MNSSKALSIGRFGIGKLPKLLLVLCALALAACHSSNSGGGGQSPPPPPPPPPSGIGPAGGTVNGPNGSSVVIPAGALSQSVNIAISQSSQGLPALPAGTEVAGQTYSFTPHGTTFAVPVRITVPFDPSLLPAGRSLEMLKTNSTNTVWSSVAGATASGTLLSGDVTGFSGVLAALVPALPEITTEPADLTVTDGDGASFTVVANANAATVAYQWRRDGVDIAGETTTTYSIPSVGASDDGATFSVVVTNPFGSVESRAALLTVNAPPAGTWLAIGGPVTTTGPIRYPSVAVAADGTIYVAYGQGSSGVAGFEGQLFVRRWDSNAQSWVQLGNAALNTGIGTAPEWPHLSVGSDLVPVIAWMNRALSAGNFNEVVVQRWNSATNAWDRIGGAPSGISGGAIGAGPPTLVLGPGNQPHVVFGEGTCVIYRTWNGTAWGPDAQHACAASNQSGNGLAVRSDGVPYVAGSPVPPPPLINGVFSELRNWVSVRFQGPSDQGFFNSQLGDTPANPTVVDEFHMVRLALDLNERPIIAYATRTGSGAAAVTELNVRQWNGTVWNSMGGNLLGADALVLTAPMRLATSLGQPGVAWATGTIAQSRITGRVWTGAMWATVPSPHDVSANIGHFNVTVGPDFRPYVALTERPVNESNPHLGSALYVRTCDGWCVVP